MTLDECKKLPEGTPVIFDGVLYDFGYVSITNHAIIYNEGERDMQDSLSVDPKDLVKV